MNLRLLLMGSLLTATGLVLAPPRARAGQKPSTSDFSGRWKYDKERSEEGQKKPGAEGHDAEHAGAAKGAGAEPAEAQSAAGAGADLTIRQTELVITVEDAPGQERSFYPNGKTYNADEGTAEIKTYWKDGAIVVEKKSISGWKMTETWELSPDGHAMTIVRRLEGHKRPKIVIKRVYDRVEPGS
jgi:hypothetical protein